MFIICGLGIQGEAVLYYLLQATSEKILGVDISQEKLDYLKPHVEKYGERVELRHCNHPLNLSKCFNKDSVVINCIDPSISVDLTIECIQHGASFIDLGGDTEIVRKQLFYNEQAESVESVIIPDCGLAPGIISSLAKLYYNEGWTSIEAFCGGIPKFPELPLGYSRMFSPEGVIREYTGVAQEIRNGKIINIPTRSGKELVFVPSLGVLEAAVTSGGVSFSVDKLNVRNFSYKTLRYPGHWDYIEKYILSQPKPVDVLNLLIKPVSIENPDIIVLMFRLKDDDGIVENPIFFWEFEEAWV
jgi:lysine 6-dehydrogenase